MLQLLFGIHLLDSSSLYLTTDHFERIHSKKEFAHFGTSFQNHTVEYEKLKQREMGVDAMLLLISLKVPGSFTFNMKQNLDKISLFLWIHVCFVAVWLAVIMVRLLEWSRV